MAIDKNLKMVASIDDAGVIPYSQRIEPELFPQVNNAGRSTKVYSTIPNLKFMLKKYGIKIRYNEISKKMDAEFNGKDVSDMNCVRAEVKSLCALNDYADGNVDNYFWSIASNKAYNPVKDWIDSAEWDGVDRFTDVVNSIKTPPEYEEAKMVYLKRWCYSAIAMLDNDGRKSYEGVLVFQGNQGIGKTKWIKNLVGDMWKYVKDGVILDPNNKDSVLLVSRHWVVELGELGSTFKKSDMDALKAWITMSEDKVRRPYDRYDIDLPRMTVLFATVNDMQFLKDATGDRRFWCIPVYSLCMPDSFNAQQFWSQVRNMLDNEGSNGGFDKWFLSEKEADMRNLLNANFREDDPIEQLLLKYFTPENERIFYASATEVSLFLGLKGEKRITTPLGALLKKHFGQGKRFSSGMFYRIPISNMRNEFNSTMDKLKRI